MNDTGANGGTFAVPAENSSAGMEHAPASTKNDTVVFDLWGGEDKPEPSPKEELNASVKLMYELETLTNEKERLKKENRRLTEMLESIKLEEDLAVIKREVSILNGENEQLLAEIQRRRQAIENKVANAVVHGPGNQSDGQ